jgi:iron complex outermembrane receptor protein
VNTLREGAYLLAAAVALWALETSGALAEDRPLDSQPGDPHPKAETGSAPATGVATQPPPTGEPRAAEGQAAATEASKAAAGRAIEEIIVTAERKEERLHEVPVSMSAFDDRFLRQQGVTDLQDVARYIPNVRFDQAGTIIEPRIRGFSTNVVVNRGLELPVGIVVDDVPYSRADYFVSGLFDLDRVEVLRGPQGQLFGANSTVGLVNLTTKNPTNEYTGFVDGQLGELTARRFEGGVGGPLPLLRGVANFRIAALSDEQDGWVRNTTKQVVPEADDVFGGRLRRSVRAKLDFPNIVGGSLLVTYQRDHLNLGPTPRELTSVPRKYRGLLHQYDSNVDAGRPSGSDWPINLVGSLDTPSFRLSDVDTVTARGRYDLGGWGLNLVAGWSGLDSNAHDDADGAPWDASKAFETETSRQTTAELRATSPDLAGLFGLGSLFGRSLGSTDLTSGIFFQRRTQNPTDTQAHIDANLLGLMEVINMLPPDSNPPVIKPPPRDEAILTHYEQSANEYSGYGQMNWHFLERWTFLYGMRLDYTTKDAVWDQKLTPGAVLLPLFIGTFAAEKTNQEFHFAPKVGMKFDPTQDVSFYASWSHNYQAGGFNNFGSSKDASTKKVKPAEVASWEAGTKTRFLDGAAEVNLGLFWMTMTDFQLFTVSPTPTSGNLPVSRVVNVGELRARGVEGDTTWLATDWLTVRGSVGFNDATYISFPLGECISDKQGPGGLCDLKGRPLEQAPHWDTSVTPIVRVPLTSIPGFGRIAPSFLSKVELMQALSVQYTDNRYLSDTDDPRTRQPSYFNLDGNVGFANTSQGWSLQFRVDNITDERTGNTAFEGVPAAGVIWKAPNPPRLMYGGFRWEF